MLASKDLNGELESMEKVLNDSKNGLTVAENLNIKCSILLLRLMRDIRSNQVIDLKSRGIELRTTDPSKKTGGAGGASV